MDVEYGSFSLCIEMKRFRNSCGGRSNVFWAEVCSFVEEYYREGIIEAIFISR